MNIRNAERQIRFTKRGLRAVFLAGVLLLTFFGITRQRAQYYKLTRKRNASQVLAASPIRQSELSKALSSWTSDTALPQTLINVVTRLPPEDAAMVALGAHPHLVVDVGANRGHPVTKRALQQKADVVLSIEPDKRNFVDLQRRAKHIAASTGARFIGIHGAAGDTEMRKQMLFHKDRDDFSCFTCLNRNREEVFSEEVQVHTVDKLLLDEGLQDELVTLFKTDTQGFEVEVLQGAKGLYSRGVVKAALVEFDPHLLMTKKRRKEPKVPYPQFGKLPITEENAEAFYDFAVEQGGWTDLFCLRQPQEHENKV